ncbi:unnamed protein product [Mytilus coruscus]|uniref:Uncharacterized protein n=1 Tax=Mytilus coruscus TaxID=42192 RepID=A0A6J8E2P2_MYTCO|nr:unnamed protein product [Mytilus coruscus]
MDRILILDSASKHLHLFSKDGEYAENVIRFEDEPNDICYIKDNLIAVTIVRKHIILLIDLLTKNITKTIKVEDLCFGIESNGTTLVVILGAREPELLTLDLEGNIISQVTVPGKCILRMTLHYESIVCTDFKDNLVSCNTNKGILSWTHKHEDFLEPLGLAIDKHGFIFVASKNSNKIVVLSEDGKTSRTILSKDDGIVSSTAIHIDKLSSTLLVTNLSNGDAFVHKI